VTDTGAGLGGWLAVAAGAAATGALVWPLVEYAVHGWLAHRLRTFVSPLHFQHHRDPRAVFTSPLAWVPLALGVGAAATAAAGPVAGPAFATGLLAGFLRYEYVHWRIHFRRPRNAREALLRQHHLAHHFVRPDAYHGVTTRWLDRLFGSLPGTAVADYARVADRPPLVGASNLGRLWPRRVRPGAG